MESPMVPQEHAGEQTADSAGAVGAATGGAVPRRFRIAVRELVSFVLRAGDLRGAGEGFAPADRAQRGTRAHQEWQKSRPEHYEKEVAVRSEWMRPRFDLEVQGRVDGLMREPERLVLEEIKSVMGGWDGEADPLHWGQVKFYAYLLVRAGQVDSGLFVLQLTYLNLDNEEVRILRENMTVEEVKVFGDGVVGEYLHWLDRWVGWLGERDERMRELGFPHPDFRSGQRRLAAAIYRCARDGGRLFAEAPTGIGKTMAALFPAVKSLGEGQVEQVFYATAKTVGRLAALEATERLRKAGARLRVLALTARERLCVGEGVVCDPLNCSRRKGYYDRVRAALEEAWAVEQFDAGAVLELADRHELCPFELGRELAPWVDVVVGDYNYLCDPSVRLDFLFPEEGREVLVLLDEAHNLVDRARSMFSARLVRRDFELAAGLRGPGLSRVSRVSRRVGKELSELQESAAGQVTGGSERVHVLPDVSGGFMAALALLISELERCLSREEVFEGREILRELYFGVQRFRRRYEARGPDFAVVLEASGDEVRLVCLDPARLLSEVWKRVRAIAFFSGTLNPLDYYVKVLGGAETDLRVQLSSPFPRENLRVEVAGHVSTLYRKREKDYGAVADLVVEVVERNAGNFLVFFPSYAYLEAVLKLLDSRRVPGAKVLVQARKMEDEERCEFLAHFRGGERVLGFVVMGGIFGEGIDLAGEALSGAIVVGVGLPQVNSERELIRKYFEGVTGRGFEFAYVFPGVNRVLQAAGRVIRSETDRGVVVLVDERFGENRYRRLLPEWWRVEER